MHKKTKHFTMYVLCAIIDIVKRTVIFTRTRKEHCKNMMIQLTDFEAKTLISILESARGKELKNHQLFDAGSVERERSSLRLNAIHSMSKKLDSGR